MPQTAPLPLAGLKVLEFSHAIMGPSAGLILADMGADVIKIEPAPEGDHTRRLPGFAAGFYGLFNRNKRALAVDLKSERGRALVHRLAETADVALENFGPGTMDRLKCGYADLAAKNPRLVYCALKGFLSGPYEKRTALDEVVQYMAGLAYMTGPPGRPLRAGTSIVDILGGTFAVVGILAALRERDRTGKGQMVKSALFEAAVLLMGQHMAGMAATGEPGLPMPARKGAWGVYHTFPTKDGERIFIGITSNQQWERFCGAVNRPDLLADPRLKSNADRVAAQERLLPEVEKIAQTYAKADLLALCESIGIPFSPVAKPEDLFDDPQLQGPHGLLDVTLPGGIKTRLPRLPIELDGHDFNLRRNAPEIGADGREVLKEVGYAATEIAALERDGVIVVTT
jgi:crotonobetainyl-CoA:carnitine CoA-transferase CaiB-like acyl-CoA transferase